MESTQQSLRPENLDQFRQARLLLLLQVLRDLRSSRPADLERLGYYDFFAANPFLVLSPDSEHRPDLALAGFDYVNLSYQSASQRFSNNRARLQFDLSVLVAMGLAQPKVSGGRVTYSISEKGLDVASTFISLYARTFRRGASLVVSELTTLSDTALRNSSRRWLKAEAFIVDLYDIEENG